MSVLYPKGNIMAKIVKKANSLFDKFEQKLEQWAERLF
jgi:hypothetical protein